LRPRNAAIRALIRTKEQQKQKGIPASNLKRTKLKVLKENQTRKKVPAASDSKNLLKLHKNLSRRRSKEKKREMQERVREILEKLKNSAPERVEEEKDKEKEQKLEKSLKVSDDEVNIKFPHLTESNAVTKEFVQRSMSKIPKLSSADLALPSAVLPLLKSVLPEPK
jgi:hypothetical protein